MRFVYTTILLVCLSACAQSGSNSAAPSHSQPAATPPIPPTPTPAPSPAPPIPPTPTPQPTPTPAPPVDSLSLIVYTDTLPYTWLNGISGEMIGHCTVYDGQAYCWDNGFQLWSFGTYYSYESYFNVGVNGTTKRNCSNGGCDVRIFTDPLANTPMAGVADSTHIFDVGQQSVVQCIPVHTGIDCGDFTIDQGP